MDLKFKRESTLNRFSRLGTWYILALSVIASVSIVGQVLIQNHLKDQLSDSRVVNVAGRQRMLSQRISKGMLSLLISKDSLTRSKTLAELKYSVNLWKTSQEGLLHGNDSLHLPGGNSAVITSMFSEIAPHFNEMLGSATQVIGMLDDQIGVPNDILSPHITTILDHEASFLTGMDKIVFRFDDEAHEKVAMLSKLEYALLIISVIVIILEILFVFRPTTVQVNKTLNQLIDSERNAKKLSKEIGALYTSLEKSYEQLSQVNQPAENPRLLAKSDKGGNVTFLTDLYAEISGKSEITPMMRLCDLFKGANLNGDWMDEIVDRVSEGELWQNEIRFQGKGERETWVDTIVIPVYTDKDEVEELLLLGSDITMRKQAEQTMRMKNKAEIEKKINQQKFRSVLILEGQEEERKRIAMDIHDGIGQMLTSLKFQIESINNKNEQEAEKKITEIKHGIKDIIREVRKVTFNLKPTVLGDYGLQAGLNVFVKEIGKLSDVELIFRAEGEADQRIPQKIENNIFRIVQEAINNAIKYAKASRIDVSLKQTANDLTVTVKDEGQGFDEKIVEARNMNIESGRGFFNMYERTEYINGQLEIKSEPGKGTVVILTVPLRSTVTIDA